MQAYTHTHTHTLCYLADENNIVGINALNVEDQNYDREGFNSIIEKDRSFLMRKNKNELQDKRVGKYCIRPQTKNGITLIALVVTVIVLIILAAITINLLIGSNGIITKTSEAAEAMKIAVAKEKIEMDILEAQIDTYGEITLLELQEKEVIDDIVDGIGVVIEDGYVFTVEEKEDGSFEVTLIGKEGEITISGSHKINPETVTSKVEITVKGTYLGQGIKEIERPDGSKEAGGANTKILETIYEVTANGEYTFKIIGNDDKKLDYKVTITNIDTEYPSASHTTNPEEGTWGTSVGITVTGIDNQGIASIEKPDRSVVTENPTTYTATANGDYTFQIKDTNNNITEYTVTVENIDREGPNVTHSLNPNPPAIGANVTITLNATDGKSGVKSITKPDDAEVQGSSTTYTVNTNGTYTFTAKDNLDNSTIYNVTVNNIDPSIATVEPPVVTGGLTPIKWNESTNPPTELVTTFDDPDWYSYKAQPGATTSGGTSKWANAKTSNGSYLVWVPRYEYKITSGEHGAGLLFGQAGKIDVKFIPLTQITPSSGYTIHPAFTNSGNRGLGELAGIWVGKFESSSSNGQHGTSGDSIKIVPNVTSWRNLSVSQMFAKSQAFASNNSLTGYDSHMMKNSEWGAVAYLAHSKYGRNGTEVTINNYFNYYDDGSLTGYAGYTVNAAQTDTANSANNTMATSGAFPYNNTYRGVLASTTGNVYGVYDMSGGTYEYTMGVLNNATHLSGFSSLPAEKYYDSYTGYSATYKGDAVYETSSVEGQWSWFGDGAIFVDSNWPWFTRGGGISEFGVTSGMFEFYAHNGRGDPEWSFRLVVSR